MQTLYSASVHGIIGALIEVEVDVKRGMGQFMIVWLGDTAVQESKERVRSAIKNSGFTFPSGARITVNLAPADVRKKWPIYDLPIALWILAEQIEYKDNIIEESILLWELALDGSVRKVIWVLPAAILAREIGKKYIFLPKENLWEASMIPDITVIWIESLQEAIEYLNGQKMIDNCPKIENSFEPKRKIYTDFKEIIGQDHAKRALMIAAAGGHNLLMEWPPWSGKTLLSKALAGILPPLDIEEKIEISKIYSVSGLLSADTPIINQRPFRTIHHTASEASIIGGWRDAKPGEISLAHKWILFLDEFLEFSKRLLETLRQPLEDGKITVNRVNQSSEYPCDFSLVGAMNPCPCGFLWDPEKQCSCTRHSIDRYRSKLSGPILDRIDMYINVPRIKIEELQKSTKSNTPSSEIQKQIIQAIEIQKARHKATGIWPKRNSELSSKEIEKFGNIQESARNIAIKSVEKMNLSTRSYYRILRVARTIADLDWQKYVEDRHILEALWYRQKT